MIKGIIFDLDGTLLNTIDDLANSVNALLNDYGFKTFTSEEYKLKVGHGFKSLVSKALPLDSQDLIDEALAKFLYYYDLNYDKNSKPYDGIKELLDELVSRDIKIAVNSNKRDDYTNNLIKKNFPNIEFIDVIGERKEFNKKPDPTAANMIVDKMGLTKDEVLYIGDSETDIKTANNANLKSVGVTWGFRSKEELIATNATYIIDQAKDILNIL